MSIRDTLLKAVSGCDELPVTIRELASIAVTVEESTFDSSYLDFLQQQIDLNARGDDWSQRLRDRMSGLANWCDAPLIIGRIQSGADDYSVYVDPMSQTVVFWERYADVR